MNIFIKFFKFVDSFFDRKQTTLAITLFILTS